MHIILVEDDYLQADFIQAAITKEFPDVKLEKIRTEREFYSRLTDIADAPPDVIIMDVMLRWTDPEPEMVPAPPEVRAGKFYRAGLRCVDKLAQNPKTRDLSLILYTVLGTDDLEGEYVACKNILHLPKDSTTLPLIQEIRALTRK